MQHVSSHIPFFTRSCFYAHPRPRLRIRLKLASPSRIDNARQFSTTPPIHYATHNTTATSSLLSQTLDQRDRSARSAQGDSVGPFMLGGVGFSQRPVKESDLKKWSELDTKGKGSYYLSCHNWGLTQKTRDASQADSNTDVEPHCDCVWRWLYCVAYLCAYIRALCSEFANGIIWSGL